MKRSWVASTIFNLLFFSVTAAMCVAYLPLLALPRNWFIGAIKFWVRVVTFLEKNILGLTYEIRGTQNLPKTGPYLIAAKHQSAYETFKLHLLFENPAIILKQELLRIPIWGLYLKKSDVIAIDRSTPERALRSIEQGAARVAAQGRPIVIFPQGTRVSAEATTLDKPYKPGIARIQAATELPIIPLALNSGLFWPRGGWLKSGGTVIFEFLEPIAPGSDRKALMANLEAKIENTSSRLMNEAQIRATERTSAKRPLLGLILTALVLFGVYSVLWFKIADEVKKTYIAQISNIAPIDKTGWPVISGFLGKIKLDVLQQSVQTDDVFIKVQVLHAECWPWIFTSKTVMDSIARKWRRHTNKTDEAILDIRTLQERKPPSLLTPVEVTTGPLTIRYFKWKTPLEFDGIEAKFTFRNNILQIDDSAIKQSNFTGLLSGSIDLNQTPAPGIDLVARFQNQQTLLINLAEAGIIKPKSAIFIGAGLAALADTNGVVSVPLTQRNQTLFAGPIPVVYLAE